ncbi:MFS transporter [Microlunatus capsulatus]|uniref:MFS family arabinose efflux permease n=1 Tax=Microlunatus capsulatus TaxID=99117 RepID=A0ABS4Z7F1_9ACTN|nr:MFS transporter [Microlunatus capsulatus]MBP2416173.1 putative MFS family arabinose efflux permease [Microlunatus capsulatus]
MDTTRTPTPHPPAVLSARNATYVAFIGAGFGFATWASRIPQLRDALQASPSTLGLVLLAVALGSLVALPLAGVVVTRLGTARTVTVMACCVAAGLAVVALGYPAGIPPVVVGLFLIGFGNGTWDVAMNVEGAAVEQRLGVAIMPRFHAGFSVGTVAGALGGAAMVALGVPVAVHLVAAAVVVAVVVPLGTRRFLPVEPPVEPERDAAGTARHPLAAWTEPRTLLIGVFVLCMAFTEGTGNDWLAVAVLDGYGAPPVAGPLVFAGFLAAMTLGRWFGPQLIDRSGRVATVRASALVALVGLLLVVFGGVLPLAAAGAVLWGLGTALGFPVGMSAAADDPRRAAGRVSVVASIGYTAFLAGPPLIGFLGDHVGVLRALTVTAGLLGLAALLAGTIRPLAPGTARPPSPEGDGGRELR